VAGVRESVGAFKLFEKHPAGFRSGGRLYGKGKQENRPIARINCVQRENRRHCHLNDSIEATAPTPQPASYRIRDPPALC